MKACCPPGSGCNSLRRRGSRLQGRDECYLSAVRRCNDEQLAASALYWLERHNSLPRWQRKARKEALWNYRRLVAAAFASGIREQISETSIGRIKRPSPKPPPAAWAEP